jgi:H+/Cl- antiporter ClcA
MPGPVRLLVLHAAIGFAIAAAFVLAILWLDPGGLAGVLRGAAGHPWPLLLLWLFCGLTSGAVQSAVAIMGQDRSPAGGEQGRRRRRGPDAGY